MKAFGFFLLLTSLGLNAQVVFDKTSHNFGLLEGDDVRYTDFVLTNHSDTDQTIISVRGDRELQFLISNRNIKPDSSQMLRVQVNPSEDGLFSKTIEVYLSTSETSVKLRISGIAKNLGDIARQQCPDFSGSRQPSSYHVPKSTITISVVNANTEEPVANARMKLSSDGITVHAVQSNRDGKTEKELESGLYALNCEANGFVVYNETTYFSKNQKVYTIKLVPLLLADENLSFSFKQEQAVVKFEVDAVESPLHVKVASTTNEEEGKSEVSKQPENDSLEPMPAPEADLPELQLPESIEIAVVAAQEQKKAPLAEAELFPEFPIKQYRPNNIVFIIDRSSSMNEEGKMALLKDAMLKLLYLLRPVDILTIISYSSSAELLMEPRQVMDRDSIAALIASITAKGTTQATKGIRKGFAMAESSFIAGGNNEVILATDGAFAEGADKIIPMVGQGTTKGIRFSVIGVKNDEWTVKQLKELSSKGNGSYISLKSKADASKLLVNEIKKHSFVKKSD